MRTRAWPAADRFRSLDPRLVDALLAVGLTGVAAVTGEQYHPAGWPRFDATAHLYTALVGLPLAARRTAPVSVLVACCLAYAGYLAAGYAPSLNFWGPLVALYGVASRRPPRAVAVCAAALVVAVIFLSGLSEPAMELWVAVLQALCVPGVVWAFGNGARLLEERNRQLAAVTAELYREQEWRARRAVAEEQRRIARELHDIVAHHMSVISVQAGMAGYVFPAAPEKARAALGTIAETSREGLRELSRILTLLRSGGDEEPDGRRDPTADGDRGDERTPYAPIPGLAGLAEAAQRVRDTGIAVELRTDGTPRPLPPGVELCAYRVAQEALTNVIKHAPAACVDVLVAYLPHTLVVTVTDDGGGGGAAADARRSDQANVAPGPGHGLIGMRERARLYGGTVVVGPRTEGGFSVRLTLPVTAAPDTTARPPGPENRPAS
ncbi:histidine kinase [Streptomyces sp. NBC_00335]|uniref:sensor histidine kinase n=1 Tax=unclassified Streptomyces TaxID=2593676 RepID=UPI00225BAAF2|nr:MULTISPECIES: histidine kinase [unclassified Streptomyces]MCX5407364.1 histidine kinase [Streptomyces sp. NBC_00086]